jgi:hypothetical protein
MVWIYLDIIVYIINSLYKCLLYDGLTWITHNRLSDAKLTYINVFYMMGSLELDIIAYLMQN